jgi:acetyl-CoA C-acetyltransferase
MDHPNSRGVNADNERLPFSEAEASVGLLWPTEVYPVFENARRFRQGWTLAEHHEHLGRLWSQFATVAASNPYAWITKPLSAEQIATPSTTNRYVGFPYTKFLVANLPVDMGAAIVLMSFEEAERQGVSRDQMVFPQHGAEAYDHWFVSERASLDQSVAMAQIWGALNQFGETADGFAHLDLYSCFPSVVQMAAEVLGIDAFDPARVPTVTGGLTFGGGPGNNYVTHSIATMVQRLREDPSARGLVTGVGWYATKHAWGTYQATPPPDGFQSVNVQDAVDATPKCTTRQGDGSVVVESYVVLHRHDGSRKRLIVVGRFSDGARVLSHCGDDDTMEHFETNEMIGTTGVVVNTTFQPSHES